MLKNMLLLDIISFDTDWERSSLRNTPNHTIKEETDMALDSYLNKRTIKAEMLNQLKTKGMDDQRLERMAQKSHFPGLT